MYKTQGSAGVFENVEGRFEVFNSSNKLTVTGGGFSKDYMKGEIERIFPVRPKMGTPEITVMFVDGTVTNPIDQRGFMGGDRPWRFRLTIPGKGYKDMSLPFYDMLEFKVLDHIK